jgi:hypothetical protein
VTDLIGPGANTNIATGGANRTSGLPFVWSDSVVLSTSGSAFTFTTTGQTFVGMGSFFITPGAETNNLAFLQCFGPTISAGAVTITGNAWSSGTGGTLAPASSGLIRINIMIVGW